MGWGFFIRQIFLEGFLSRSLSLPAVITKREVLCGGSGLAAVWSWGKAPCTQEGRLGTYGPLVCRGHTGWCPGHAAREPGMGDVTGTHCGDSGGFFALPHTHTHQS